MNLNEVKKHVYFNMAIYIGIGICFIISLIAILITPVKAIEQTSDITNSIRTDPTVCNTSGGSGVYCVDGLLTRNVKTTYNGRAQCIGFAFDYYFMNGRDYTVNIVANSNDFRNNSLSYSGYSYTTYPGNASSVNVQGRFINKQKIQIVFPYDPQETHVLQICSNNSYMTGDTNYNIKQVYLTYDDGQQDISGIVDNATQNTTDIINNSNSNTQDIINAINQGMTDMCPNRLNLADYYHSENGAVVQGISPNGIQVQSNGLWAWLGYKVTTDVGKTYYIKGNMLSSLALNGQTAMLSVCPDINCASYLFNQEQNGSFSGSFTATSSITYVRLYASKSVAPSTGNYYDVMLSDEDKPFCVFGTTTSKIDESIKAQEEANRILNELGYKTDDTNAYLKDDTNPNVPTSDIENTLDLVEINNPLGYLLTLPLTLISKINQSLTATCSDFELGHFGFSGSGWATPLKFPCLHPDQQLGSSLWTTIDIIVAVGLLALTVYKIYQAVSNILTLGGEDEVSGSFVYWTPMEFLAIICGGTSVGVFQRRNKQ